MNVIPNQDQLVSLITKAIVAATTAWAASHGFSVADWSNLIAYVVGIGAILASHYYNRPTTPTASTPPTVKLMVFIIMAIPAFIGCTYMKSNTHSVTNYMTNGVQVVEQDTHARAFTFFDANGSLAKFRNGSTTSTLGTNVIAPGTYVSGLTENSSSAGVSNLISAALNLAIQAAITAAK